MIKKQDISAQFNNLPVKKGAKKVYDKKGNEIGVVDSDYIYNSNGARIAKFDRYEKRGLKKVPIYNSENGEIVYEKNKLVCGKEVLGFSLKKVKYFPFFTLMLALVFSLCSTIISINHIYISQTFTPTITVGDSVSGSWGSSGTIMVFDNKIYPGKHGTYTFFIKNSNEYEIIYSFSLDHFYNGEEISSFPVLYKLKLGETYLTDVWLNANELHFDDIIINSSVKQAFVLEWYWPFENEEDNNIDTWLGVDNGKYSLELNLTAQLYER